MAEERAAEPLGSNERFDGAAGANGGFGEGGEGRLGGAKPTRRRNALLGRARALVMRSSWHGLALAAVLILSAFLNLLWLPSEGYANPYYSAGVKNMLTSWHNFFFASFDSGFVSIDKPPLGLWSQAASAWL